MRDNPGWKMYIFRDGKYEATGAELISRVQNSLCRARCAAAEECEDQLLAALIAAGELECALLDARADDSLLDASSSIASLITDGLARAFLNGRIDSLPSIHQLADRLDVLDVAGARFQAAVQEGFAYYALHPRKLARLLNQLRLDGVLPASGGRPVRVLGIRSIGVTLSAVACAALGLHGVDCRRISVRPGGHPYDRRLLSTPRLCQWVRSAADAEFLVVDEGPGISGSSFLAVAEALVKCGIQNNRIHLIGSRLADPAELLARDAARRWSRFCFHAIPAEPLTPPEAGENFSGDARWSFFGCAAEIEPGSWTTLEPASYLAQDRQSTFTFAGFGHYGEAAAARCNALAEAGFAPRYLGCRRGFIQSALPAGRLLTSADISPKLISKMAEYLAFRAQTFAVHPTTPIAGASVGSSGAVQAPELEVMLRRNWQLEFGEELGVAESRLNSARVVICDGRMGPHEWLRSSGGDLLKLHSGNHGGNHFFPGPCDIAWDLADCIAEWELEPEARRCLIDEYTARTGDAIAERLAPYLAAYTIFCMARAKMAVSAMHGDAAEKALLRDYNRYRTLALRFRSSRALCSSTPTSGALGTPLSQDIDRENASNAGALERAS